MRKIVYLFAFCLMAVHSDGQTSVDVASVDTDFVNG